MWARLHARKCERNEELREGRNREAKGASQKMSHDENCGSFLSSIPIPFELLILPPGKIDTRSPCHLHHLPRVQTRAGGGSFQPFDTNSTTPTSLVSKREPEVVNFGVLTRLPPPPPPSRLNASRRWSILAFRYASHYHHLPRVQT